jgi:aspartate aminotransferase
MVEAIPVIIPTTIENDFKITAQQLEDAITDKTRMMIYSSPCNPTGSVYNKKELESLSKVIFKHKKLIVLSDEIYEHINFVGHHTSLAEFNDIYEQVVTVNGVSKAFAMTGWRLGYIGAPKWIADACTKIQGQFTSGTSSISQRAAKIAVEASPSVVNEMLEAFKERRDLVLKLLNEIPGIKTNLPEGAFYVFPNIKYFFGKKYKNITINNSDDLTSYILDKANVALVTGDAFGAPNCIRISYSASNNQLIEALRRIKEALSELV